MVLSTPLPSFTDITLYLTAVLGAGVGNTYCQQRRRTGQLLSAVSVSPRCLQTNMPDCIRATVRFPHDLAERLENECQNVISSAVEITIAAGLQLTINATPS